MKFLLFVLMFAAVLAGCAPESPVAPPSTAPIESANTQPESPAATDPTATTPSEEIQAAAPVQNERPNWQNLPIVNARTGQTFTFADFAGQTVFVEPMATWCTNCRQQLGNVRSAREQLGSDVIFIALSVETNITAADLAAYADDNGFDWHFAVMTPELLTELVNTFGRTISNPPSTPHFIIRADGTATSLATGIETSSQIVAQIQAEGGA